MENKKILKIPVGQIIPNPNQPRKKFNEDSLRELEDSIRNYGILQPITVRGTVDEKYEIIAGERRFRSAKMAGLYEVPVLLQDMNEEVSAIMALLENLQREDLNFIEEAMAYENLMKEFSMTQQELAKKVGKNQSTIANKLRVLKLSDDIKNKLVEYNLSERHARALLKLPQENMRTKVLDSIIKNDLNVKKAEKLIKDTLDKSMLKDGEKKTTLTQKIKASINFKIYVNTIKNAYKTILDTGLDSKYEELDMGDYVEVKIKIPKNK